MKQPTYALGGLQTDPGPFSGASDGALVEAHNVVCERKGLLEPRGGMQMVVDSALKAGGYVIQRYVVAAVRQAFAVTGGGAWIMRQADAITVTGPTQFTKGRLHAAYVRGRSLFTSEQGVCEWPVNAGVSTVAFRAGVPQPSQAWGYVVTGGGAGTWLANNQSVAYRFTIARARADGSIMESAPSAPFIVRNTSGSSGGVEFVPLPGLTYTPWDVNSAFDALQTGDMLRVYRAPVLNAATGTPSDVMRLRAALPIVAGAVQAFTDKLPDADWNGAELYTNSKRETILQARNRPAYARDLCVYKGMTVYAGHKTPHRARVTCKAIGDISADPQQALCTKTLTLTTASGTPNLTVIGSDVKYLAPGQWITLNFGAGGIPGSADARFPVNTQIATVNYTAQTATINANALASGAISVTVWDWVGVTDGVTTYRQFAQEATNTVISGFLWLQAHNSTGVRMGGYADLEYHWNNASNRVKDVVLHCTGSDEVNGRPEFRNVLMVFERASFSSTSFAVKSSKPNAFDLAVDHVTGVTSAQDGGDARLGISVPDIPDAVPDLNTIDIGNLTSPIYRVITARSSVLVFKADGIYSVYGNDKASLNVTLLDATVVPPFADIAANWIAARGDTVYMMSSRGPMAVTEAGTTPFGEDILETLRETFRPCFELAQSFTSCSAGAAAGNAYVFFSYDTATGSNVFAFNTETGAWTTWGARLATSCFHDDFAGFQGFAMGYRRATYYDRRSDMGVPITASTHPLTGDYVVGATVTINSVTPNGTNRYTIVIAAGSEWTPTVGDTLIRSGVLCVVESVASATTFDVAAPSQPTTGSATFEESYPVRLTWTARTFAAIANEKRNVSLSFVFAMRALLLRLTSYFQTSYTVAGTQTVAQPAVTGAWDASAASLLFAPESITVGTPRDVVLDWGLRVGLRLQQARSWFSLGAIVVDAEDSGTNVGRVRA